MLPFYFARAGSDLQTFCERTAPLRANPAPTRGFNVETLDLRPQLGGIGAPTLVVVGQDDWICTVSMAEELIMRIPGTSLVTLADCGHVPWLEARERFHAAIRDFVRAIAPAYLHVLDNLTH